MKWYLFTVFISLMTNDIEYIFTVLSPTYVLFGAMIIIYFDHFVILKFVFVLLSCNCSLLFRMKCYEVWIYATAWINLANIIKEISHNRSHSK